MRDIGLGLFLQILLLTHKKLFCKGFYKIGDKQKIRENRLIFTDFWSRRRDLNPRPSRPERDALPAALRLDFLIFYLFS